MPWLGSRDSADTFCSWSIRSYSRPVIMPLQFEYKGKRYHHILSPKTGYPVDTDLEAVSLVTVKNSSMDTDAMSTICLMKGTKAAKKFIDSQKGIEAAFYGKDNKTSTTEGMDFEAE